MVIVRDTLPFAGFVRLPQSAAVHDKIYYSDFMNGVIHTLLMHVYIFGIFFTHIINFAMVYASRSWLGLWNAS